MICAIDTSILVAAMLKTEAFHEVCDSLIDRGNFHFYQHGIPETFSTVTGGKLAMRILPNMAVDLIENDYLPYLTVQSLTPRETMRAMAECESRGVRGGAIYDYLHLVAARKAKAERFYTLNDAHFRAFRRVGDPDIVHPAESV